MVEDIIKKAKKILGRDPTDKDEPLTSLIGIEEEKAEEPKGTPKKAKKKRK